MHNQGNSLGPLSITSPYASQRNVELSAHGVILILATNRLPLSADSSCGISLSTDRGSTWGNVLTSVNIQKLAYDRRRPGECFAAAEGGIYRSTNGGTAWSLVTAILPSAKLVDIRRDSFSDTLYIATADSGVYKNSLRTLDVAQQELPPKLFRLEQNHPNPFNPVTSINFHLPVAADVMVTVYDGIGRQVRQLPLDFKSAGAHTLNFDARGLSSGVYYYRVTAGGFIQTRKMVLLC